MPTLVIKVDVKDEHNRHLVGVCPDDAPGPMASDCVTAEYVQWGSHYKFERLKTAESQHLKPIMPEYIAREKRKPPKTEAESYYARASVAELALQRDVLRPAEFAATKLLNLLLNENNHALLDVCEVEADKNFTLCSFDDGGITYSAKIYAGQAKSEITWQQNLGEATNAPQTYTIKLVSTDLVLMDSLEQLAAVTPPSSASPPSAMP